MTLSREDTHSFIVRIWCEPREIEGSAPEWRGTVEHVSGGQRRYFRDLDEIAAFVSPYLVQMGVKVPLRWRLRQWKLQWKRRD
jgi:hypothetical protein